MGATYERLDQEHDEVEMDSENGSKDVYFMRPVDS